MINYNDVFICNEDVWVAPSGVNQIIIWRSRVDFKIIQVKQGVSYVVDGKTGIFGDFCFKQDKKEGFTITYWYRLN